MKKKRFFYVLEKFLKSSESIDNQKTDAFIPSDSLSVDDENTRKEIETTEDLQNKIEDENEGNSNLTPFNIDQGNLIGKYDFYFSVKGKMLTSQFLAQQPKDLNADGSGMKTSSQEQSGLQQDTKNTENSIHGQQDNEGDTNNPNNGQLQDNAVKQHNGETQDNSTKQNNGDSQDNSAKQHNGEPQNNPVKQLFSELDKVSESIDKGHGFALSPLKLEDGQIPDSVINMLIDKFLNQRFLPTTTDLNTRRNSFDPDYGDLKWNIPDLVRHKVTKDLNKMLYDKYGYNDEDGKRRRYTILILF